MFARVVWIELQAALVVRNRRARIALRRQHVAQAVLRLAMQGVEDIELGLECQRPLQVSARPTEALRFGQGEPESGARAWVAREQLHHRLKPSDRLVELATLQ